jgi:integrase
MEINNSRYIDFKVYEVTKIKDKYGFRIKLIFDDGTESIQQKAGFNSQREAKKERDNTIGLLYSGAYIVQKKISVSDLFNFWIENEIKLRCTHNTYYSFRGIINNHINPKIGNITLTLLNKAQIQNLYEQEAEKSHSALRMVKAVIESGLKYALNKQLISYNPSVGVKISKTLIAKNREYKPEKVKTLTEEQLKLLIEKSKGTSIYMQVLFSGLMGLRVSEVNGLKYTDVDFVNKKLKVQRQLGIVANSKKEDYALKTYTKQEIPVKSFASNRELDIPDIVFNAILEQRKIYEKNKHRRINDKTNPFQDLGYICCSSYGRPRCKSYNFPHFKKILKENNLPDIRWHDLRATYATILMKNNFSLKAISKRMGHSRLIITADIYGDKKEIVRDCTNNLIPFLQDVLPRKKDTNMKDLTKEGIEVNRLIDNEINELTKNEIKIVNATTNYSKEIINEYFSELIS